MSPSHSNLQAEQPHLTISPPAPIMALAFAALIEIAERFFGRRYRQMLDGLARRTAEVYAAETPHKADVFRCRLGARLSNRHLALVDWWEDGHGH